MTVHLAADHAGFEMKEALKTWLASGGYEVVDHGAFQYAADDNFTDFVFPAAKAVSQDETAKAIVLGGSGQGEAMAANRIKGVRAFVFYGGATAKTSLDAAGQSSEDKFDIVRLSRVHNNSNVFSVGARFVDFEELTQALQIWLTTAESTLERYSSRNLLLDQADSI